MSKEDDNVVGEREMEKEEKEEKEEKRSRGRKRGRGKEGERSMERKRGKGKEGEWGEAGGRKEEYFTPLSKKPREREKVGIK